MVSFIKPGLEQVTHYYFFCWFAEVQFFSERFAEEFDNFALLQAGLGWRTHGYCYRSRTIHSVKSVARIFVIVSDKEHMILGASDRSIHKKVCHVSVNPYFKSIFYT